MTRISLADYPLPVMDEDLEKKDGMPENAFKLARLIDSHDAVLIARPEYNCSMSPLLKNTIDWFSRVRSDSGRRLQPYAGKLVAICSSSDSHSAGIRSANHLRAMLSHIQMEVIPPHVSVPNGDEAFDDNGNFREGRLRKAMQQLCHALTERAIMMSRRVEP